MDNVVGFIIRAQVWYLPRGRIAVTLFNMGMVLVILSESFDLNLWIEHKIWQLSFNCVFDRNLSKRNRNIESRVYIDIRKQC